MKILHLIASVNPAHGGPIESVLQGATVWARLGHEMQIACLDHPSDPWVKACPIAVHALGQGGEAYNWLKTFVPWLRYSYSPRLVPWLKTNRDRYDAIVVNGLWNYAALAAKRALSGSDAPYLVFSHGMLDPWFKRAYPLKHIAKQLLWLFSEGPLLTGQVVDIEPEQVRIGLPVRATFRKLREEGRAGVIHYGYKFAPREPPWRRGGARRNRPRGRRSRRRMLRRSGPPR